MVEAHDGLGVPLRLHNLLLAMAGRLDDSALSEARELVARSRLDEAAELTAGALIAGKIPVRSVEQRELALILEMSRSDATLVDEVLIDENEPDVSHRFTGENEPERGIADALDRALQVLPDLRSVHAVWRNTPAGSVPGPLPQRVVLVEIGPEGHPPAVAFRVDTALRRVGIRSVVEVTGPGADRTGYYKHAMTSANRAWHAGTAPSGGQAPSVPPPAKAASHAPAPVASAPAPAEASKPRHELADDRRTPEPPAPVEHRTEEVQRPDPAPEPAPVGKAEPPAITAARQEALSHQAEYSSGVESTTDMSSAEVAQLRRALAEDPETGRAIASAKLPGGDVVELPELDLNDPKLSDRDRKLLRELHAELAQRERAEAARLRLNGAGRGPENRRWVDGFSGA
ncbi:hypothetical protein [Amycolatopsis sp. 195334CR]|uniref:hypothetical protein n=1 Tax=Amycolatopsis sp. 195334CR TaxID=2814588 RepID=UPI001A8E4A7F|nr:hypothetical protein [Amycolatopsis sp. 195334CR]MBN6035159.1 hypothetical protein [Amycolatopsis sp. 195334CR]